MLRKVRFLPTEIRLSEGSDGAAAGPATRVQVIRTGSFKHPEYGNFKITKEHLDAFVKNFNEKVRGIDIAVDYKHESEAEAGGWFKSLEVESLEAGQFGLLAEVDWTKPGAQKLSDKEFRYLSADFTLRYKDPETGKDHGPVLLGAGLTNRPFIKGMDPVVKLSEQTLEGANAMTPEQMMAKIAELEAALAKAQEGSAEFSAMKQKLSEYEKKASEDAAKAKEDEEKKALADKNAAFDKMLSEKKVIEAQRVPFMANDTVKFAELAGEVKEMKLSENKTGKENETVEGDASDKIISLAEALVKEKKADSFDKAVSMVLSDPENKKLREEHEKQFN